MTRIGIMGRDGPCMKCGPSERPTPGKKVVTVAVTPEVSFRLCESCYRDFYVALPVTCCAFQKCQHERQEAAFNLKG